MIFLLIKASLYHYFNLIYHTFKPTKSLIFYTKCKTVSSEITIFNHYIGLFTNQLTYIRKVCN